MSKFVEIDDSTYSNLEEVAKRNGYDSVEKLLTQFANDFSSGCSVTLNALRKAS